MNGPFGFLLHGIFITIFSLLYAVSVIILRPFRTHSKRPVSTILLKLSYLLYLLVFIILSYVALFYFEIGDSLEDVTLEKRYTFYYIIMIIAFFIPNLALMIRRKINRFRVFYNFTFSIVNFIITLVLIYIIFLIMPGFK